MRAIIGYMGPSSTATVDPHSVHIYDLNGATKAKAEYYRKIGNRDIWSNSGTIEVPYGEQISIWCDTNKEILESYKAYLKRLLPL
jgi:hypothetical protein